MLFDFYLKKINNQINKLCGSYIKTIVISKIFIRMLEECIRVQEEVVLCQNGLRKKKTKFYLFTYTPPLCSLFFYIYFY